MVAKYVDKYKRLTERERADLLAQMRTLDAETRSGGTAPVETLYDYGSSAHDVVRGELQAVLDEAEPRPGLPETTAANAANDTGDAATDAVPPTSDAGNSTAPGS
jgi:hypothetical protein